MIVKNPTENRLEVQVQGVTYVIEPEGTLENVPEAHARYWQESLHKFIVIRNEKKEEVETVVMPKPKVEEVVTEEVKTPAPEVEAKKEVEVKAPKAGTAAKTTQAKEVK